MIKRLALTACCLSALLLGGCGFAAYRAPVVPPRGMIYTQVTHPLTTDYRSTPVGSQLRKGSDKVNYLYIPIFFQPSFGWGEGKIAEIAKDSGIKEVSYAEADVMSILGIYTEVEVMVYGQ